MRADALARLVPLEGVHARLAHELEATGLEPVAVARVDEVQLAVGGDEAHPSRVRRALLVTRVPAQGRDPDAQFAAGPPHLLGEARQAARGELALVVDPEPLAIVVPAVVHQVGAHRHAALADELGVEGADDLDHPVVGGGDVIPAIVMEEGGGFAGALALHVAQEGAAQLALGGDADDRAEDRGG